ncbi:DUF1214 domain-containing protein [Variovorax sp. J22P168]|nr:DUF1214 domain-containing protein [Variovorax sp. J22P168]MDM0015806.1 DUF1214 domain-containing protein [Variovorax sp. J22P168]
MLASPPAASDRPNYGHRGPLRVKKRAHGIRIQDAILRGTEDVPVDGFWSLSVYNAAGYYEKNAANAYSLNNLTAKRRSTARSTSSSVDAKCARCQLPPHRRGLELHGAAVTA